MRLLLPEEYCDTLEPLYMQCPVSSFKDVKNSVETELGKPLHELFAGSCIITKYFDRI